MSKEIKEIMHSCGSYQVQGRDEIIIRCFICGKEIEYPGIQKTIKVANRFIDKKGEQLST